MLAYVTCTLPPRCSTQSCVCVQVYDGSKAWWSEADAADPVNAYGRSKLEAEQLLQSAWPGKFVALRSSLIYGPEAPLASVDRPLFLQFVRQVLQSGKDTTFFVDEYRRVEALLAGQPQATVHDDASKHPGCTVGTLGHVLCMHVEDCALAQPAMLKVVLQPACAGESVAFEQLTAGPRHAQSRPSCMMQLRRGTVSHSKTNGCFIVCVLQVCSVRAGHLLHCQSHHQQSTAGCWAVPGGS